MLIHQKIKSGVAAQNYGIVQKSINKFQVAKASELIGKAAAIDMMEFAGFQKSDIHRLYVKYRDGLHLAIGMRSILKKVDIRYLVSERSGLANKSVSVDFWGTYDSVDSEELVWFADPINARGTTAAATLEILRNSLHYDTAFISHILANQVGIRTVQSKISDFSIDAYMNYDALSKRLNEKTGYLDDGLKLIPDYGDKLFGTVGADYSCTQLQADFRSLLGTQAGRVNVVKAIMLFILQKRWSDPYMIDRQVQFPTRLWVNLSLLWYSKLRRIPHLLDMDLTERNVKLILNDMVQEGFITSNNLVIGNSIQLYYKITEEGRDYASKVFNPVLGKENVLSRIQKDMDFLIHLGPKQIHENINAAKA